MTIEEKLKDLICAKYGNMLTFSKEIGMANSTLATIMKKGIHKSNVVNIIKICQALEISTDELAKDRIVPVKDVMKEKTHMTDLDKIIEYTRRNIQEYSDLTIDGQPMTQNEIEMLLDALDIGVEIIKRNRRRI